MENWNFIGTKSCVFAYRKRDSHSLLVIDTHKAYLWQIKDKEEPLETLTWLLNFENLLGAVSLNSGEREWFQSKDGNKNLLPLTKKEIVEIKDIVFQLRNSVAA